MDKASPARILSAHRGSYIHAPTGRRRRTDHLFFEALPVATALGLALAGVSLPASMSAAAIALAGLLTLMGFAAFLYIGVSAARLPAQLVLTEASPGELSRRRVFLGEVLANTAYATLAGLVTMSLLIVGSGPGPLWRADALALGAGLHLLLVFAMVMKRLMAVGERNLLDLLTLPEREREPVA